MVIFRLKIIINYAMVFFPNNFLQVNGTQHHHWLSGKRR